MVPGVVSEHPDAGGGPRGGGPVAQSRRDDEERALRVRPAQGRHERGRVDPRAVVEGERDVRERPAAAVDLLPVADGRGRRRGRHGRERRRREGDGQAGEPLRRKPHRATTVDRKLPPWSRRRCSTRRSRNCSSRPGGSATRAARVSSPTRRRSSSR